MDILDFYNNISFWKYKFVFKNGHDYVIVNIIIIIIEF